MNDSGKIATNWQCRSAENFRMFCSKSINCNSREVLIEVRGHEPHMAGISEYSNKRFVQGVRVRIGRRKDGTDLLVHCHTDSNESPQIPINVFAI